jgi:hypothetical protein
MTCVPRMRTMAEGSGREHPLALEGVGGWTCRRRRPCRVSSQFRAFCDNAKSPGQARFTCLAERAGERTIKARSARAFIRFSVPLLACWGGSLGPASGVPLGRVFELAFPHNPFECFLWILDPILVIGAIGRKQLHDLIGAIGDHVPDGAGREIDALANTKLVFFQRGSSGRH